MQLGSSSCAPNCAVTVEMADLPLTITKGIVLRRYGSCNKNERAALTSSATATNDYVNGSVVDWTTGWPRTAFIGAPLTCPKARRTSRRKVRPVGHLKRSCLASYRKRRSGPGT